MPTPATFASFEDDLVRLAAKFEKEFKAVVTPGYPEARLRDDYLNPLLRALGWDLENAAALIQSRREVEIESRTDIEGHAKRADYLFRIDSRDRFVCEAKKPASRLGPRDAFQAKRYAFNMNLPLAVLCDFEEIKIYVVGGRPHIDRPAEGHWKTWHFKQYPFVAQEIWDLLARERIAAGSIDSLLDSLPKRAPAARGGKARQAYLIKPDRTRALDADFLTFLDEARHDLASSILQHNARAEVLADDRLNAATQHILDRLLFIRICEDRDIDTGTRLASIVDIWRHKFDRPGALPPKQASFLADPDADAPKPLPPESLWSAVVAHFSALDHRPPGNVPFFNGQLFKKHFSEDLLVGDRWLADFIARLSDDESPYLFNIIPVEILGSVYERFLGKVIRPHGRGVKTEEKPEVRKAGGVYYTPRYIVDYIVEQTVGKLAGDIADAGPKFPALEKRSRAVRILDPACGSGSFLIRAFERMCEHWLAWFTAHPEDRKKKDCWVDEKTGDVHLTVDLKRRVLRDNVFGVDLDPQAVEVTQLSLYLKMLEGETRQTLARERELFGEAIALLPPLDANIKCGNSLIASDFSLVPEDLIRVRAFDWPVQFKEIMQAGGFDAVVGNPPYIQLSMEEFRDDQVNSYLKGEFTMSGGRLNTFTFFIEKARALCSSSGYFGQIVPNTLLTQEYYEESRLRLIKKSHINVLAHPCGQIFDDAVVENIIVVAQPISSPGHSVGFTTDFVDLTETGESNRRTILQSAFAENYKASFILPADPQLSALRQKLNGMPLSFGDVLNINQAIALKHDRAACLTQTQITSDHHEILDGRHIGRYFTGESPNYFKFDLAKIHSCKREDIFLRPEKMFMRRVGDSLIGTLDTKEKFALNTLVVLTPDGDCPFELRFLLGLFNSRLMNFFYTRFLKSTKKVFSEIQARQVAQLPISLANLSAPADQKAHDRLVALVDKMLTLTPKLRAEPNDAKRAVLENAIAATDHQIDALVYQLHGLSPEEIALVENATVA